MTHNLGASAYLCSYTCFQREQLVCTTWIYIFFIVWKVTGQLGKITSSSEVLGSEKRNLSYYALRTYAALILEYEINVLLLLLFLTFFEEKKRPRSPDSARKLIIN